MRLPVSDAVFSITANVFSLCVRAGLEALSCQPAPMPNRSTTIELTTSARMTQNECYALVAVF